MSGAAALLTLVEQESPEFPQALDRLRQRGQTDLERVEPDVRRILADVRQGGDQAVADWAERLDGRRPDPLLERDYGGAAALSTVSQDVAAAMRLASARIRAYHERQLRALGDFEVEQDGVRLASRATPLARVGVYTPGGKARYPSSVLMSALIAQVAGVREILVATPDASPEVRAACHLAGVTGIVNCGGAHAVGALAYGTESIPRVDKIVGPGNIYVAAAKRLVFGEVDIDSIAGPSEILVVADESAEPEWVAADLLSQAEHDEAAYPLLVTSDRSLAERSAQATSRQLQDLPRRRIAEASLLANGVALVVSSREALVDVANALAAEHVALHVRDPRALADRITRAGALFVGHQTPEAAGDYVAGPSHVLPTGGAARYAAPLGVYDFVSRSSVIEYSAEALRGQGEAIEAFARAEGLEAHARAVSLRTRRR
ncbi:MAG: histidinol dehydrogenase [Polyangiaceae bacterium]